MVLIILEAVQVSGGFNTELDSGIGAGKWQESASCTVYGISGSIKLPELSSNPQVAGPKCQ